MIRLVSRGCFTRDYAKGLVSAPEDREPAVRKLIEGAGGNLLSFYFTTGDTDFMLISEAENCKSLDWRNSKRWPKRLPKQRAIIESPARANRVLTAIQTSVC
jgi:hypothetical protein